MHLQLIAYCVNRKFDFFSSYTKKCLLHLLPIIRTTPPSLQFLQIFDWFHWMDCENFRLCEQETSFFSGRKKMCIVFIVQETFFHSQNITKLAIIDQSSARHHFKICGLFVILGGFCSLHLSYMANNKNMCTFQKLSNLFDH